MKYVDFKLEKKRAVEDLKICIVGVHKLIFESVPGEKKHVLVDIKKEGHLLPLVLILKIKIQAVQYGREKSSINTHADTHM